MSVVGFKEVFVLRRVDLQENDRGTVGPESRCSFKRGVRLIEVSVKKEVILVGLKITTTSENINHDNDTLPLNVVHRFLSTVISLRDFSSLAES